MKKILLGDPEIEVAAVVYAKGLFCPLPLVGLEQQLVTASSEARKATIPFISDLWVKALSKHFLVERMKEGLSKGAYGRAYQYLRVEIAFTSC